MIPRIVEIEWVDSATTRGWGAREMFLGTGIAVCRTVGYVLEHTKKQIVVVQSICIDTGNYADSIAIPTRCIKRLRRISAR
jgi:hypothetical protein